MTNVKSIVDVANDLNKKVIYLNGKGALHHCSPSGGGWGVVRVACLIPEIEVLFVIPMGCGRHGSIAAFANGTADKLSFLLVQEVDLVSGDHLRYVEDAIEELILEKNPRGMIVCSTCMDDLLGSDYESIERYIENKYTIPIRHGKMNPILLESNKSPEVMIQKTIYEFWSSVNIHSNYINIIGSFGNLHPSCELIDIFNKYGFGIKHISECKSFDEYMQMQNSVANLLVSPRGTVAVKHLSFDDSAPILLNGESITLYIFLV